MPQKTRIKTTFFLLVLIFVVGTLGYSLLEGWTIVQSFYATVITLATVGYGDYHPVSVEGQLFTVVLIIFGVGITAFFVKLLIENLVEGQLRKVLGRGKLEKQIGKLSGHFIICGCGKIGYLIGKELFQEKADFVIIERNPEVIQQIEHEGFLIINGSATEDRVLKDAGIERAQALVSVLPTDADNLYVVLAARELNPKIFIMARYGEDESSERRLLKAGANRVMSPYKEGGMKMALAILKPAMLDFIELTTNRQSLALRMEEATVSITSPIAGMTLEDSGIRKKFGLIVVAIKKSSGSMIFNPEASYSIERGDRLISLGEDKALVQFAALCSS